MIMYKVTFSKVTLDFSMFLKKKGFSFNETTCLNKRSKANNKDFANFYRKSSFLAADSIFILHAHWFFVKSSSVVSEAALKSSVNV